MAFSPNIHENPHSTQTICELHRKMYRMIVARNPNDPLLPILQMAFNKAKKMGNKLRKYKFDYDDGWWEIHKLDGGELDSTIVPDLKN